EAITTTIREWVDECRRGLLEKSPRIQAIAGALPPLEGEDADYIKYALTDIGTARIFLKHAKSPEWISGLERHAYFRSIFAPKAEIADFHWELGGWLIESFLADHSQALLAAVERNGGNLNPRVCWWVWRRLVSRKRASLSDITFLQWTVILM